MQAIDTRLNKIIYLELLYFMRNNPSVADTLDGIASKIGRTVADIEPVVRHFLKLKLIEEQDLSGTSIFVYNADADRELQKKRLIDIPKMKIIETVEGMDYAKK
jgi:hypothetical protein